MSARPWDDPPSTFRFAEDQDDADSAMPASWEPIPLGPVLAGDLTTPVPSVLRLENDQALFYQAAVNGTHGESGIGKSWIIAFAIAQELNAGQTVMLLDYEDSEQTLTARLTALGVRPEVIDERVIYIRPQESATPRVVDRLCEMIVNRQVSYVAIDSVGEALAVEGLNEDRDNEVGPWVRILPRRLADAGAAVHLTDHSTKSMENPLHPSGSKRKRAAITGASYLVEAERPLVKSTGGNPSEGRLRLTCAKDRHGNHPRGQVVATFVLTSWPDEGVTARLWPPTVGDGRVDITGVLAARDAVRVAKEAGEPLSQRALVGLMRVKASTETKRTGIEVALSRGALVESSGPRNSRMFAFACELDLGVGG